MSAEWQGVAPAVCCDSGVDRDLTELRRAAEQLVTEAAEFVRRRRSELADTGGKLVARSKSSPTDPVTVADTEAEALVRRRLADIRPGEEVLGEEQGGRPPSAGGVRWVVDPIDGTVNFLYGIPAYAVSLAAEVDGRPVAGAVADVCSGEVYSAALGSGAWLWSGAQRRALRCTGAADLSMALVGTGFGYLPERRAAQAALLAVLLPRVRDIRRMGSAALDLCHVAAGRLDAHFEHGLNVWDWAAGALIAAEAGAVVMTPDRPSGLVVAAVPGVATALLAAIEESGVEVP